jgi:hypothetical protein
MNENIVIILIRAAVERLFDGNGDGDGGGRCRTSRGAEFLDSEASGDLVGQSVQVQKGILIWAKNSIVIEGIDEKKDRLPQDGTQKRRRRRRRRRKGITHTSKVRIGSVSGNVSKPVTVDKRQLVRIRSGRGGLNRQMHRQRRSWTVSNDVLLAETDSHAGLQ